MDEIKDEIKKKKKDGWIEALFSIEALGANSAVVQESLKNHIEKLKDIKDTFVYETQFSEITKVMNPTKNIKEAHSQIVNVKLFMKNVFTMLYVVMNFGPSSIEVMSPNKKEIDVSEMQSIANVAAGIVHQFAAAGVGGIIITPK